MRDIHVRCQYVEFTSKLSAFIVGLAREHQFQPRRLTITIVYTGTPKWDYYSRVPRLPGCFFEVPLPHSLEQICIRHETLERLAPGLDRLMAHMATKSIPLCEVEQTQGQALSQLESTPTILRRLSAQGRRPKVVRWMAPHLSALLREMTCMRGWEFSDDGTNLKYHIVELTWR
jgi:hypothetical protein